MAATTIYSTVQITSDPDNADRHVALRVLGLLRRRADRIEPDVGEEDDRRAGHHAAEAEVFPRLPVFGGMNGFQLSGSTCWAARAMNRTTTTSLMTTMTLLTEADSLIPTTSSVVTTAMMRTAGILKSAVTVLPSAIVTTVPRAAWN